MSDQQTELPKQVADRDRLMERQRRCEQVLATFDAEHAELLDRLAR